MTRTASTRRTGVWPLPIYEAHYDDGEVVRLSFHWPIGKPLDPARGRRGCDLIYAGAIWRKLHKPTNYREHWFSGHKEAGFSFRRDEWGKQIVKDWSWEDNAYIEREVDYAPIVEASFDSPGHMDPALFAAEADFRRTFPAPFARGFVEHPAFGRKEDNGAIITTSKAPLRNGRTNWRKACESALAKLEAANITRALEILRATKSTQP